MWRYFRRHYALNIVRHIAEQNLTFLSPTSRTEHSPPYRWTHSDTQCDAPFTDITYWIHTVISLNTLTHNLTILSLTSHTEYTSSYHWIRWHTTGRSGLHRHHILDVEVSYTTPPKHTLTQNNGVPFTGINHCDHNMQAVSQNTPDNVMTESYTCQ